MAILSEVATPLALRFSTRAREMSERGDLIISLGLGEPSFPTPVSIIESTHAAMQEGFTRYSRPQGLPELRDLIRAKLLKENDIEVSVDQVIVTPGAKQALLLVLLAILEPDDGIINIAPCYPSFVPQITIAEPRARIHTLNLNQSDFGLPLEAIRRITEKRGIKAILINYPHNPTGQVLPPAQVRELVDLAADAGCYVISDEIYERLMFSDDRLISPASLPQTRDTVVTINGMSKAYAMTGWRIGYCVVPPALAGRITWLQQHINTNPCTFVQKGSCAAFLLDAGYLDRYRSDLRRKAQFMMGLATANPLLRMPAPKGGLFGFLDVSATRLSSDEFATRLLIEKNVATTPGIVFGSDWDQFVRVSLAASTDEFTKGFSLLDKFVRELDHCA